MCAVFLYCAYFLLLCCLTYRAIASASEQNHNSRFIRKGIEIPKIVPGEGAAGEGAFGEGAQGEGGAQEIGGATNKPATDPFGSDIDPMDILDGVSFIVSASTATETLVDSTSSV